MQGFVRRHPVTVYFAATFAISWIGAVAVAAPSLIHRGSVLKMASLMMFPVMLVGPCATGIAFTWITGRRSALKELYFRMRRIRGVRWYLGLLVPPVVMFSPLLFLKTWISSVYAPNRFLIGTAFGVIAGFLEVGWTGFAFPTMSSQRPAFSAAVWLGILWGFWHLPVIDFLGAATPHGSYLLSYFLAFTAAMTAMRVLIAWLYTNTQSIFLAQLMHVSSTALWLFLAHRRLRRGKRLCGTALMPLLGGVW